MGEGWHEHAGGPHAELIALRAAGGRAKGATLYATLEPCSRFGRTPPCVDAVVGSGIAKVVVGSDDPSQEGSRAAARARGGRRGPRPLDGAETERGVAHVEDARASVRHVQGGGHARRPRDDSRLAVDLGRGVAAARARAARSVGRGRRGDGHGARGRPAARRARRRGVAPAAADRVRARPAPGRLRARAALGRARRGAAHAGCRGRAVAPARGRPDDRDRVPRARADRQAAALRGADALGRGAALLQGLRRPARAHHTSVRRVGDDVLYEGYLREP